MKKNGQLLAGVVPGDYLSVVYGGASSLFSAEGYVKQVGEVLVLTREGWGVEVRVPEEWLVSVTVANRSVPKPETPDTKPESKPESKPIPVPNEAVAADKTEPPVPQAAPRQKSEAPAAAPTVTAAPAPEPAAPAIPQPKRELAALPARTSWTPNLDDEQNQLRLAIKNAGSKTVRNSLNAILDSMRDAQKTGSIADKYQSLRAKTLTLWDDCAEAADYYSFYWTLGLLSVCAEDYLRALEPLVRCQHYSTAACAAEKAGHEDYRGLFVICALMAGEPGTQVNQDVADICLKRQDVGPLFELLAQRGEDRDTAELLLACAWSVVSRAGCAMSEGWETLEATAAAEKLLAALPASWRQESKLMKKWEVYDEYTYPVTTPAKEKSDEDAWVTGTIKNYRPDRRFGFIAVDGIRDNVYFYIKQVAAEKPIDLFLRNLLYLDKAVGLEVSFTLGESPTRKGQCAANDIYLTEKGYEEAVKRITAAQHPEEKTGCITEYPNDSGFGRLYSGGKPCNYVLDSIVDPYLRAYLSLRTLDHSFQDQDVLFLPVYRNEKLTAQKIRWKNPRSLDLELVRGQVSEDSAALWKEYLAALEEAQQAPVELPDKTDPYPSFTFELLDDWMDPAADESRYERPLTWKISSNTQERAPLQTTQLPPVRRAAQAAPAQTPSRSEPSAPAPTQAKLLIDCGKKAILANELDKGEQLLLQALEHGAPAELVVGDLISLYLRFPEKIPGGIALLERYQSSLEPDKVLNMRISLYDKQHNYDALLPLYEEAIRTSPSTARKSHNLFRMLSTLIDMDRYEQALEVCDRWNRLYRENLNGPDGEKLRNAVANVERKRAICLLRLGRDEEAKAVAQLLLKANPANEAALQILRAQAASAAKESATEESAAAPIPESAAEAEPAPENAVPAEEAAAPAEEVPAPAEEVPAPAEEVPVPAEEIPAPAEEIPAPAEDLNPAPEDLSPAEPAEAGEAPEAEVSPENVSPAAAPDGSDVTAE